uniref:NADH-ubiquinone oxidoreductase chain 5 n=1 Tax=Cyrtarachne nagasakiensis TaxID=386110 RepID=A0A0U2KNH7_9ARAC|nr:NADH dehydrogenase subunit 5 [Cyrtarachne nagasakiensis]ALF36381.1 NADH dehydrogenase subunit 5 [Cyrtarachne nagasakiensis]
MFQSMIMFLFSFPLLFFSIFLLFNSTFISLEIPLISIFNMNIPISILLDWTSMLFLFTVMFILSMILLFSMEYIPNLEHKQFFMLLLMFVLSMSFLILSDNIIFILLGWDGLGLTSFILVVYYQNFNSASSGSITIFSNRIGDILILISIALLTSVCNWNFIMNEKFPMIVLFFLMFAACSKSAQFPFSAWLPAAMAAPTPISALVHSSTLVTAGVYILIRIMNNPHPNLMFLLLMISSMTAIYASMAANWEMDMKKIIALSTLSQIAMMMFAISLGAISMAFFHLIIHAMFKSMMFLCAGFIIHTFNYQDMRKMGTLNVNSPLISSMFGISSLSLMGIPFMSGFFSKDPIIETILISNTFSFISTLMIFSIGLTSAYTIRMMLFTMKFYNKFKPDFIYFNHSFMEYSIMIMAPLSILFGNMMMWVSIPEQNLILPNFMKLSIILVLFMGLFTGTSLFYYSNKYILLGQAAISLWFNHILTALPFKYFSKIMNIMMMNDKNWQETYGPKYCYNFSTNISNIPDKMMNQLMFIIMILTMSPILMFLL